MHRRVVTTVNTYSIKQPYCYNDNTNRKGRTRNITREGIPDLLLIANYPVVEHTSPHPPEKFPPACEGSGTCRFTTTKVSYISTWRNEISPFAISRGIRDEFSFQSLHTELA